MSVYSSVLAQLRRMTVSRSSFVSMIVISLLAVVLSACSLAAPAPVGNADSMGTGATGAQAPMAQAQPMEPMELPTRKPSAASGADLYQQKCVRCHGSQGRGDGEMAAQVQQQFSKPVADLTSDVNSRAKSPEYWYQMVTIGNLQAGMPGFSGSLDVNQRWDVIAYVWTLSAPPVQITKGQDVYAKQCVQCHGLTGQGDGPDAKEKLSDFSQIATFAKIEAGKLDQELASTHIPSFAGTTSELERRAVIDYIRTFAYDAGPASGSTTAASSTPTAPTATTEPGTTAPAPAPAGDGITVQGYLINGTNGEPVPGNLPITFYVFPGGTGQNAITQSLQTDAQGHFVVTTTQAAPGDLIAATTEYKQLNFFSSLEDYAPQVTVPITIYESTMDSGNVGIDTLHIVAVPGATGLEVSEIYVLSNTGDRIVAGFGQPVLRLGLPANATQVMPDTNMPPDVLVQRDGGLDYYDAIPVGQNGGQVVFQYVMPTGSYKLDRPLFQNVKSINLLVQGDAAQLNVTGGQLTAAGTQDMQGTIYQQFRASNLTAGQTLSLTLAGPGGAGLDWRILAGIGLVVVGVVGLFVWQRGRSRSAVVVDSGEAQRDALIDQIAALDDDFAAGNIDEVNYKAKRAKLKERLLKLM